MLIPAKPEKGGGGGGGENLTPRTRGTSLSVFERGRAARDKRPRRSKNGRPRRIGNLQGEEGVLLAEKKQRPD